MTRLSPLFNRFVLGVMIVTMTSGCKALQSGAGDVEEKIAPQDRQRAIETIEGALENAMELDSLKGRSLEYPAYPPPKF